MSPELLQRLLFYFGVGFFVANVKVGTDLLRYQRRRRSALLIWQIPKPRHYHFSLTLGVILLVLFAFKLFVQHRQLNTLSGEAMMSVYYLLAVPLSTKIARGFYEDGVWSDTGFMRWGQISAVTWKEEDPTAVRLILVSHLKSIARHLHVPGHLYGQARRLLQDRVRSHDIHIGGAGLDLGSRDQTDGI
jgi:hypothetical protein